MHETLWISSKEKVSGICSGQRRGQVGLHSLPLAADGSPGPEGAAGGGRRGLLAWVCCMKKYQAGSSDRGCPRRARHRPADSVWPCRDTAAGSGCSPRSGVSGRDRGLCRAAEMGRNGLPDSWLPRSRDSEPHRCTCKSILLSAVPLLYLAYLCPAPL